MSNIFYHVTGMSDSREVTEYPFDTLEEFYKLKPIQTAMSYSQFNHFAYSENNLMGIYKGGFEWWVYGRTQHKLPFPEWDHGRKLVLNNGKEEVWEGKDIQQYCGGEITHKDGTVAQDVKHSELRWKG